MLQAYMPPRTDFPHHLFPKGRHILSIAFLLGILVFASAFYGYARQNRIGSNDPSRVCNQTDLPYQDSTLSIEERVNDLMGRMTTWEKIGQMTLVEKNSVHDLDDIYRYNLGALLSGFGAKPEPNTPQAWLAMVNSFQAEAQETCLKIPLLYGVDAVHGHTGVLGATVFPHAIGLGATHDAKLVERVADATAEEMAATGIYWNFSPNLDVVQDTRWGRVYETFGSEVKNVSSLGDAALRGLQTSSTGYLQTLGTLKHFVGLGAMEWGTSINPDFKIDQGNVALDEKTLRAEHLVPFQKALSSGARVVMAGLNTWNGQKTAANTYLLTDVLKTELGFSGFVVSDWYGVYEISKNQYDATVKAVNAGVDMVMLPFDYKTFMSNMEKAIQNGDISAARLDDAVKRILTVKFEAGLFDRPDPSEANLSVIGSDTHRELAREAVRASQVILKNTNRVIPVSPTTKKILVAGSSADNIGRQSGAWTVEWQGIDGNWIPGTSILAGIRQAVSETTEVVYSKDGKFSLEENKADIGIAIVGEKPYAEGWGDDPHPALSPEDLETIRKVKAQSKKVIVIIVSGRPLDISAYVKDWDGVIAAWLPGSEGEGVADTLFGAYPFTGTLPLEWKL
jgi:beta-glucosidase